MSEIPVKIVVDLSQPKGQRESIIPLTTEEIEQRALDSQAAEVQLLEQAKLDQAVADAKASGIQKLSALGLSDAEIAAITGA